ncbi:MAG: hypothetical protein SVQ76_01510 [Candidatus Nanohaloarchaea archaeon]|nr:hypothetical protein [Candidatus Nanohaloarchaea archaeon]
MRRELAVFGVAAVLTVGYAAAAPNVTADEVIDNPSDFADIYNQNAEKVPDLVKSLVAGERINIHLSVDGRERVVGIVMNGSEVGRVVKGGLENPSISVYTSRQTVRDIVSSDQPGREAVEALNDGRITYSVEGIFNKIKFGVVSVLSRIAGFFM